LVNLISEQCNNFIVYFNSWFRNRMLFGF